MLINSYMLMSGMTPVPQNPGLSHIIMATQQEPLAHYHTPT